MKYKPLTDGDLDLNHLLSCQKPHSSEPLAVLAWCKPSERAHSSSELAQAEETPVLRQTSPVLLATAQAQNAERVKVQGKPGKNPIQVWNSSCQRTATDEIFSEASDLQLGSKKLVAPGSVSPVNVVPVASIFCKCNFLLPFIARTPWGALPGMALCHLAGLAGGLVWDGSSLFLCRNRSLWLTRLTPLGANSSSWACMYWSPLWHQQDSM